MSAMRNSVGDEITAMPSAGFTVDPEVEAAYIYLDGPTPRGGVARTVEVIKHVYVDFAADGRVLGIEFLDVKHFPEPLRRAVSCKEPGAMRGAAEPVHGDKQ